MVVGTGDEPMRPLYAEATRLVFGTHTRIPPDVEDLGRAGRFWSEPNDNGARLGGTVQRLFLRECGDPARQARAWGGVFAAYAVALRSVNAVRNDRSHRKAIEDSIRTLYTELRDTPEGSEGAVHAKRFVWRSLQTILRRHTIGPADIHIPVAALSGSGPVWTRSVAKQPVTESDFRIMVSDAYFEFFGLVSAGHHPPSAEYLRRFFDSQPPTWFSGDSLVHRVLRTFAFPVDTDQPQHWIDTWTGVMSAFRAAAYASPKTALPAFHELYNRLVCEGRGPDGSYHWNASHLKFFLWDSLCALRPTPFVPPKPLWYVRSRHRYPPPSCSAQPTGDILRIDDITHDSTHQ